MLEVSQVALENDFYMVDIPFLIEKKISMVQSERFLRLQTLIAANNRTMEDKDYKVFSNNLLPQEMKEKVEKEMNTFNREKFEMLRNMQG
ncbi:hypothetical protein [Sporosarcina jiandibaonis]|uniref:hypothetical protein n=1 Tax=Sporosarcina jiandibaonis TaxID=2715535 RepID=UPI001555A70D|nr:hypothetical protein [Sporosarcina jiandibaonis]